MFLEQRALLRIVMFLAAFGAGAALTAKVHATQDRIAGSRASTGYLGAASGTSLPNAYMTANGRLFTLGELLAGASRLHVARVN